MKPAPATEASAISVFAGSAATRALRELARVLAGRLGEHHGDVALEVAVLRVARAFDHDLGGIWRLGQNRGNK